MALTKTCVLTFPSLLKSLHLGPLLGAFPAQEAIPSRTGLSTGCWYRENTTYRFDKGLLQREPRNCKTKIITFESCHSLRDLSILSINIYQTVTSLPWLSAEDRSMRKETHCPDLHTLTSDREMDRQSTNSEFPFLQWGMGIGRRNRWDLS